MHFYLTNQNFKSLTQFESTAILLLNWSYPLNGR